MTAPQDTLVVARTPLRLSLGGGGTDLPFYADRFGGDILSVTISLHVTVTARQGRIDGRYRFTHEDQQTAARPDDLANDYVRAAARRVPTPHPFEVASLGPVPAGTGLGSSGAFAVSLLGTFHALAGGPMPSRTELIEQACALEMQDLGRPIGRHDQYICGLGGLQRLAIGADGTVKALPTTVAPETLAALDRHLRLFFTGITRDAATPGLAVPAAQDADGRAERIERLHRIREIGAETLASLEAGRLDRVPELMRRHWAVKRGGPAKPGVPAPWDGLYELALRHGAEAGKLVGAGGGGFLLLYASPDRHRALASALAARGATEVPFSFVPYGTTLTRITPNTTEALL
ncbi:hypothetical protein [Kitasatospora sp. NPDC089509]|uniref:GHMP family kinase ATP-binding protein n=1 Tax=Kitasatospora sp. NPDC089509 TaxID=3364079 RepID=UPI0038165ED8